jgi:hypothetical protein
LFKGVDHNPKTIAAVLIEGAAWVGEVAIAWSHALAAGADVAVVLLV